MPIFTLFFLLIFFYIISCSKNIKEIYIRMLIFSIVLEIFNIKGAFLNLGNNFSNHAKMAEYILTFIAIMILYKKRHDLPCKCVIWGILLWFCAILGLIQEFVYPYEENIVNIDEIMEWDYIAMGYGLKHPLQLNFTWIVKGFIALFMYIINVIIIKKIISNDELQCILHRVSFFSIFIISYAFMEIIIRNNISDDVAYSISTMLVGETDGYETYSHEGRLVFGLYKGITCLSPEPSICATGMWCISIYVIMASKVCMGKYQIKSSFTNIYILALLFLMISTGGFSAIWYSIMTIIIFLLLHNSPIKVSAMNIIWVGCKFFVVLGFIIGFIVVMIKDNTTELGNRLNYALIAVDYLINSNGIVPLGLVVDSSYARLGSIFYTLSDAIERPVLGLGMCVERAHGTFATMISYFGILGTWIWWKFIMSSNDNKYDKYFLITVFIIGMFPLGPVDPPQMQIFNIALVESTRLYSNNINMGE